ncbi:MAG TPA: hypothetical protein EYH51_17540 [Pseudomonas pachastrellae]|nr:hypothetical protein [Halopseudomonas pachastrellae]
MITIRLGALNPPDTNRSAWARKLLTLAIELELAPVLLPRHKLTSFTVSMPPGLGKRIKQGANQAKLSPADYSAGLIEAVHIEKFGSTDDIRKPEPARLAGESLVHEILRPLMRRAHQQMSGGKVVFVEAATGTGKGRLISALAAEAARSAGRIVISAPMTRIWRLIEDLSAIPEANEAGIRLVLERQALISPAAALGWAQDNDAHELIDWINTGGKPISPNAIAASKITGTQLCWLLEDAIYLAENLPINAVALREDNDIEECEAEKQFLALCRGNTEAAIVLCSHHSLASHFQLLQTQSDHEADDNHLGPLCIPVKIGALLVDEAHLFEDAMVGINTNAIHLRSLQRLIKSEVTLGKKPALLAVAALEEICKRLIQGNEGKRFSGLATEESELAAALKETGIALSAINQKKLSPGSRSVLNVAIKACNSSSKVGMRLQVELSPVRNHPSLMVGRSNLQASMEFMWDQCRSAALISATLYSDGSDSKLIRWKLSVPPARAAYLPSVHPDWVKAPVRLHECRTAIPPDDSDQWAEEAAAIIADAAAKAKGGTLVLCTSHRNAASLEQHLAANFGPRLILQTTNNSAASCVARYREMYKAGIKPIWLGTGAAWTGVDLSDHDVEPAEDMMLSDLLVTRLPVGLNRTLTHERRAQVAGFGIVAQEACWQLRQGISPLVRREGVCSRNLWVLDTRLDSKLPWVAPFLKVLRF